MLLEKGLNSFDGYIDMWDIWHRRQLTEDRRMLPRGTVVWCEASEEVKRLHHEHTRNSLVLSNPLVLLTVGRIVQNWISKEAEKKISLSLNDVHAHVHLEENTVQRLVVDCPHPETMYYPQAPLYGKIMDTAINFAVALAGLDMLYVKPDHFASIGIKREQSRKVDKNWGTLQGQESKVLKMVRMRKFEKDHNAVISFSEIPELITRAFARKLGIPNTETAL